MTQYKEGYPELQKLMKEAKKMSKDETILINLSGRGDEDIDFVVEKFPIPHAKF